ncbi:hypothetical protein RE474_02950 [Methanolobus sediminis]|uniref:Uncharacterized protein n=1 Tax=Methanolobus sediminis TaxID=3072978 RepID=A0AA51ULX9_9EURY|nr:hypothetical protein [Methanolobus sediminis]WMW25697.1 hypothetical protein RE474_02950 [Methanolobus sediminis]
MLSKEGLCGIIDALGALTQEEIYHIIKELSLLKGGTPPVMPSIKELCVEAEKEHLIVAVSAEEIAGTEENRTNSASQDSDEGEDGILLYYISGPNAFPEVPFELSEVIDILELHKREVNLSSVAARLSNNLHRRIKNLENKIESVSSTKVHENDLENLELRYSDILNQYYDYTFWLSDDMPGLEDEIQELSSKIESLKSAQGI